MASIERQRDDHAAAVVFLNEACKENADNWRAYYRRALSLDKIGRGDAALLDYLKVIQLFPGHPDARLRLADGVIRLQERKQNSPRGNEAAARKEEGSLAATSTHRAPAELTYEATLRHLTSTLQKAIMAPKLAADYNAQIARLHALTGNLNAALTSATKAITLDPENAVAATYRAGINIKMANIRNKVAPLWRVKSNIGGAGDRSASPAASERGGGSPSPRQKKRRLVNQPANAALERNRGIVRSMKKTTGGDADRKQNVDLEGETLADINRALQIDDLHKKSMLGPELRQYGLGMRAMQNFLKHEHGDALLDLQELAALLVSKGPKLGIEQKHDDELALDVHTLMTYIHLERLHDYAAAAEAATVTLRVTRHSQLVLLMRAEAWQRLGHLDRAAKDYSRLVRMYPSEPRSYLLRARCLMGLNLPHQALYDYYSFLRAADIGGQLPDDVTVGPGQAKETRSEDDRSESSTRPEESAEEDTVHTAVFSKSLLYKQLGKTSALLHDYTTAVQEFHQAVERDPSVQNLCLLAQALMKSGDTKGAVKTLHRAVDRGAGSANAFMLLADCIKKTGDFNTAITYLGRAIAREPHNAEAYNQRALCRNVQQAVQQDRQQRVLDSHRGVEGIDKLDLACAMDANADQGSRTVSQRLTRLGFRMASVLKAKAAGAKARVRRIDTSQLNELSMAAEATLFSNPMEGKDDFDRALELDPYHVGALLNRAELCATVPARDGGSCFGPIQDYTRVLGLDPRSATALVNRGACHAREGNLALAITDYDAAIRVQPKGGMAYYNRAVAYEKTGNNVQALADLKEARALMPGHRETVWNLVLQMIALQDWNAALMTLRQALSGDTGATLGTVRAYRRRQSIVGSPLEEFQTNGRDTLEEMGANVVVGLVHCRMRQFGLAHRAFMRASRVTTSAVEAANGLGLVYLSLALAKAPGSVLRSGTSDHNSDGVATSSSAEYATVCKDCECQADWSQKAARAFARSVHTDPTSVKCRLNLALALHMNQTFKTGRAKVDAAHVGTRRAQEHAAKASRAGKDAATKEGGGEGPPTNCRRVGHPSPSQLASRRAVFEEEKDPRQSTALSALKSKELELKKRNAPASWMAMAHRQIRAALQSDPNSPLSHSALALLLLSTGQSHKALEEINTALATDISEWYQQRSGRATVKKLVVDMGWGFSMVVRRAAKRLDLEADDPVSGGRVSSPVERRRMSGGRVSSPVERRRMGGWLLLRAAVNQNLRNSVQAKEDLEAAVLTDPSSATAVYTSAVHALTRNEPEVALPLLQAVLALSTSGPKLKKLATFNKGVALFLLGQTSDAFWVFTKLLETNPDDGFVAVNRALVLHRQGRVVQADADFARAADLLPCDDLLFAQRGHVLASQRRLREAMICFATALHLNEHSSIDVSQQRSSQ